VTGERIVLGELRQRLGRDLEIVPEIRHHLLGKLFERAGAGAMKGERLAQPLRIGVRQADSGDKGSEMREQLLQGQARQILGVHPGELLAVEDRRRGVEPFARKELRHLLPGQDFAIVTRAPAEQSQIVVERLGEVSLGAEFLDRGGPETLGQPLLVGAQDERQVPEDGHRPPQRLEERNVLRGVRQVILAAQHVGDAHVDVVADHRHVVGRGSVGAQENEVVEGVRWKIHRSAHQILEANVTVGHAEAHHKPPAGRQPLLDLSRGQALAGARVAEGDAALLSRRSLRLELLGGAETAVRGPLREQLLAALTVAGQALALQEWPLVPDGADPGERGLDLSRHRLVGALAVGVFDAQHEGAAPVLPQQVVVDGGAGAADVQEPGGRGCEAHPHGSVDRNAHALDPLGRGGN
jgi:hypothetical protein